MASMLMRLLVCTLLVVSPTACGGSHDGPQISDVLGLPALAEVRLGMRPADLLPLFTDGDLRPLGYVGYEQVVSDGVRVRYWFDRAGQSDSHPPARWSRLVGVQRIAAADPAHWQEERGRLEGVFGPPDVCQRRIDDQITWRSLYWNQEDAVSFTIPAGGAANSTSLTIGETDMYRDAEGRHPGFDDWAC